MRVPIAGLVAVTLAGLAGAGGAPGPAESETEPSVWDVIEPYGSLRYRAGFDTDGRAEVQDSTSRIGIRGELPVAEGIRAIARVELGLRLVEDASQLDLSGDPGGSSRTDQDAVTGRLGYVGIEGHFGRLTWGKQWSPHYDVSGWTDSLYVFGGSAAGTYNAGTDGSRSGTGRAEQALQYRRGFGPMAVAAQVQNRSSSSNDRDFADTWGLSLRWEDAGLSVGGAFTQARDGVDEPASGEPASGDEIAIAGVRYDGGDFLVAFVMTSFDQHERDDLGRYFDGYGFEAYAHHDFGPWRLQGGWNELQPDDDHPGSYRVRYGVVTFGYRFYKGSAVFVGARIDGGESSDGEGRSSVFGTGMRFNF